jgi:hypothetical protein
MPDGWTDGRIEWLAAAGKHQPRVDLMCHEAITETSKTQVALRGMQNGAIEPYLLANNGPALSELPSELE